MEKLENIVPQPKSRFLRVKCLDCGHTDLESKFISQTENKSVELNYLH